MKLTAAVTAGMIAAGGFPATAAWALTGRDTVEIEDARVPLYNKPAGSYVRTPIASGVTTYKNEKATLDASNVSEGYIMVKYTGSVGKIKIQITKSGSVRRAEPPSIRGEIHRPPDLHWLLCL